MIHVLPGDVCFTKTKSLLGQLIRWAETDPGESKSWANHALVVTEPGWLVPPTWPTSEPLADVVESLWRTMEWAWYTAHRKETGNRIRAYRPKTLHDPDAVVAEARFFVGDKYGWWKLFAHLADRTAFRGTKVVSRLLRVDSRPICSYTVARSEAAGGVSFGMVPQAADPDEMQDYCAAHPELFVYLGEALL